MWCWSSTRGVSAPLNLELDDGGDEETGMSSGEGEAVRGVERLLSTLEPRVAATEGDGGGSGERVK